jgi:hypothetical protein
MRQFQGTDFVVAGLVIAALTIASPVFATADTHVVHPGESIQAAVDAASPGDTILVTPGTYRESVRIGTDGLTLRAHGRVTLKPPKYSHSGCYLPEHVGICIVPSDFDPNTFTYGGTRVRDVTVSGFRVVGFEGIGVFGFGTQNLTVSHVVAIDDTGYGVASFEGIGTTFTRNEASGSHDAGIYVGDSLNANALVKDNRSWGNTIGILMRHVQNAIISGNEVWGNCLGVFLLNDGQAGGSGHTAVMNNTVVANNEVCEQFGPPGYLPPLGGGGIVLTGSQDNAIFQNVVRDNQGTTLFSGGIVLIATPKANTDNASTNNLVFLNRARGNDPADIVEDDASVANLIVANHCRTSKPDGLCGF